MMQNTNDIMKTCNVQSVVNPFCLPVIHPFMVLSMFKITKIVPCHMDTTSDFVVTPILPAQKLADPAPGQLRFGVDHILSPPTAVSTSEAIPTTSMTPPAKMPPMPTPRPKPALPVPQPQLRVKISEEIIEVLCAWFNEHITDPYPDPETISMLARKTGITTKQVSDWFGNRRRYYEKKHGCTRWVKKPAPPCSGKKRANPNVSDGNMKTAQKRARH